MDINDDHFIQLALHMQGNNEYPLSGKESAMNNLTSGKESTMNSLKSGKQSSIF